MSKIYPVGRILIGLCSMLLFTSCLSLGMRDVPVETLNKKYAVGASRFIDIDGTKVHYRDEGQGPTLLLVHGIIDSLHTWDGWQKELGGKYRIVRLDLPGFGLTGTYFDKEGKPVEYNARTYTDFIEKFVTKIGLKKFHLVGNSLGGGVAWVYASHHPERINRMVLLDPAGYPMSKLPFPIHLATIPVLSHVARFIAPRFIYTMNVRDVFYNRALATDELVDRFFEINLRPGNRKAMINIFHFLKKMARDPDFSKRIATLNVPTLVIWGKNDKWIPSTHMKLWKRDLKGAEFIMYDKTGHVPQLEAPKRSAADAHRFLSGKKSSRLSAR